ncbi:hypothetical protein GG851_18390 [Bordetella petrii]|nr:hypothetical protein [Bordetella petrii]
MKYVLIGAGNIGREIIKDILAVEAQASFLAIDANPNALTQSAALDRTGRVETQLVAADTPNKLEPLLQDADVVINCTYGERIVDILQMCIQARASYIDINGTLFLEERLNLTEAARKAGIAALICNGVSPGLTNMLAAYGARKFKGDVVIECEYATHRPLNITEGLLETALRQFRNGVKTTAVQDRKIEKFDPFHGRKTVSFPHIGEVDLIYTPHTEPLTVLRFVPNAATVTVRGTYEKRIMKLLESMHEFGLLDPALEVDVNGQRVNFQPILRLALMGDGKPRPEDILGMYAMRVRVQDNQKSMEITIGHAPGWEKVPQGRMTALPTSYVAQQVAHGRITEKGVCVPEQFSDELVEGCLQYLEARGMYVQRS